MGRWSLVLHTLVYSGGLVEKQSWDPSLCGGRVVHKHQAVQREWPAHAQVKTMGLDLLKVMFFKG